MRGARERIASLVGMAMVVATVALTPRSAGKAHAADVPVKPNIVLIMTDDQGADLDAGLPYLNSRPFGSWVTFDRAYLNNPLCCPSRASIFTGQYSHHAGVENNSSGENLDENHTFATWLRSANYRTALFGKYLNGYPFGSRFYVPPGWTDWLVSSGGGNYYDYTLFDGQGTKSYGSSEQDYSSDVLANAAAQYLTSVPEPFFAQLSLYPSHAPFTPALRHKNALSGVTIPRRPNFNEADVSDKPASIRSLSKLTTDTENKRLQDKLESMRSLLSVDEAIQKVLLTLSNRGILEDTIVIFMTDNGYTLGEHRLTGKRCQYEECVQTPFMVRVSGQANRTESRIIGNVDLASTFAELAGVEPSIPQDGRSVVPLLYGSETDWRSGFLIRNADSDKGVVPFWGMVTQEWKYVELSTGEKELYDLEKDPYELDNRAGNSAYAGVQRQLAAELAALRNSGSAPTTSIPTTSTTVDPSATTTTTAAPEGTCAPIGNARVSAAGEVTGSGVFGTTGDCVKVIGSGGADSITVGSHAGTTKIVAGAGDDKICARNGSSDVVKGGDGKDTALVDASDTVESVSAVSTLSCSS